MSVRREDRQHQFAVCCQGINLLFLKVDRHTDTFQLAHRIEQGDRVSRKAADRLGNDHIDLACPTILEHSLELWAILFGAGAIFISIHSNILPLIILLNHAAVIANLRRE